MHILANIVNNNSNNTIDPVRLALLKASINAGQEN